MKRHSFRLTVFLLSALLIFAGCGEKVMPPNPDSPSVFYLTGGTSEASLIRPSSADNELLERVGILYKGLTEVGGKALPFTDDASTLSAEQLSEKAEILIGNTDRPETREVLDSIGYFDYAIRHVGNKLVVAAHTRENLFAALNDLEENLLAINANGIYLREERTVTGDQTPYFSAENPLSAYRIVYPDGNRTLEQGAKAIASAIKKRGRIDMEVTSDASPASGHEILLGVTNRSAYSTYYTGDRAPNTLHCRIVTTKNDILLCATGDYAEGELSKRFIEQYVSGQDSNTWNLQWGLDMEMVAYPYDTAATKAPVSALRVMSYNVLSEELTNTAEPFANRSYGVAATIAQYTPDLILMQEVQESAYAKLEELLGDTYAFTEKKTPNGSYSFTTMCYNQKKLTLMNSGNVLYGSGNQRIRLMSWALFRQNSSGKTFLAISTHWDIVRENRPHQSAEMVDYINRMAERYKCPVIAGGDFNTRESEAHFVSCLEDAKMADARTEALKTAALPTGETIDHLISRGLTVWNYHYLKNRVTEKASDHYPLYVDYLF